jgi:putative transcriptional regulator
VTELLFLYECTTAPPTRLQPIADRLSVTVQAASHAYRTLARRGLVESREGRYRPTIAGVDWLHSRLGELREDLIDRLHRLRIVRSCRALAGAPLRAGEVVSLSLDRGLLTARPGSTGASTGKAGAAAREGAVVEIVDLDGIIPIEPAPVQLLLIDPKNADDAQLLREMREQIGSDPEGIVAAVGLEAFHLLRRATSAPVLRFGVGAAAREASQLGIPSSVVVSAPELPRLLADFGEVNPPPMTVRTLSGGHRRPSRARRPRTTAR